MYAFRVGFVAALLTLSAAGAQSQSTFSPAITVNNGVITYYDLQQRVALLEALGAPAETLNAEAAQQLTEDALKLQLAEELGVVASDAEIDAGIAEFAGQRNLSAEALIARNADFGVTPETMAELIRAGLVWRQIVQGRFRSQALPNDRELDAALNIAAAEARESLRLAEIVLPFAERGQAETMAFATELSARLNAGADFAEAARTLSRAQSGPQGGALDWIPADRVPPLVSAQVLALAPGEVTAPIPFPAGVVLLKLIGQREESAEFRPDVSVTYAEFRMSGAQADVAASAGTMRTCADSRRLAAAHGQGDPVIGPVPVLELSPDVALRIARLDTFETDVLPVVGGYSALFLCQRTTATDPELRDQMRALLFSQRISALGNGLLQELRRSAVIVER